MIQTETTVLEKWSNMDQRNGPYNMVLPIAFNVTYERNLYLEKWFAPPPSTLKKHLPPPPSSLKNALPPRLCGATIRKFNCLVPKRGFMY